MPTPVHLWKMETVNPVDDGTPGGNAGVGSNVSVVPGKRANALDFNGNDSNVNVGDVAELNAVQKFTIAFWMKQGVIDQTDLIFVKTQDAANSVQISTSSSGLMRFLVDNGGDHEGTFDYSILVAAGAWRHVAVVFDGTGAGNADRLKAYVNGTPVELSYVGTIPSATANLAGLDARIGWTSSSFDGELDDFRIYDDALTQDEVKAIMAPDIPTISGIANDGDGDGATVSILTEIGSTAFLYSRERNSLEAWTLKGSRAGDGDIAATGYTNNTNYESILVAMLGTAPVDHPSSPSIPVGVYVTDSAGFYSAVRQALYDWVSGETGVDTIWYRPNAPQPTKPYAALNMGPTQNPRWDYKSPPDAVNGVSTLRGDRDFTVEIQIHGRRLPNNENEAMTLAEQLSTSLQKNSIIALFDAADCAFVDRVALTDLSGIGGTEFEARVSLDLLFRMGHEDTDTVGVIETVDPVGATLEE